MNARLRHWLTLYQYAAGICDTSIGLLMICFPPFTFSLLGFQWVPGTILLCASSQSLFSAWDSHTCGRPRDGR